MYENKKVSSIEKAENYTNKSAQCARIYLIQECSTANRKASAGRNFVQLLGVNSLL